MRVPLATMMRLDHVTRRAGHAAEGRAGARGEGTDALLQQRPRAFNRVVVVRVRGQEPEAGATCVNDPADAWVLVGAQVVEDDDVAGAQLRREPVADPGDERLAGGCRPLRAQRDPPLLIDRPDQRQVVAPVHRARFDVFRALLDPRVRAAHREVRPGVIDKNEAPPVDAAPPAAVRRAFPLDVRAVDLTGPRPFFLSTYPARRTARHRLDGVVWWAAGARRLYAQQSSAHVASRASAISAWSIGRRMGDCQPPPLGTAATVPSVRNWITHRWIVRAPTAHTAARSSYVPSPASYASI